MMNLADPELELIDPTPNVHSMFLNFDKTFFWSKLSSRCVVRWSKRMYSCAGICSYEGRGGLCDIALSEPLLKLRPRKDMVETLLHEMIHAYLFITRKDQDRDGHGPNFQAHMHRINRAAGLNISIYHDFHDEVKVYQTHWWRCNGPCQQWRPHFGIVRRTANRAPGKSDFWWNDHRMKCGGTFIKIKEPEKKTTKKATKATKPIGDITKYINNNNNNNEINNNSNIHNKKTKTPVLKDTSNLPVKSNVGVKSTTASTIVVNKKSVIFNPQVPKPVPFSGRGEVINDKSPTKTPHKNSNDVRNTVREVWANKQIGINNNIGVSKNKNTSMNLLTPKKPKVDNTKPLTKISSVTNTKHKAETHPESPPAKIKKIDDYFKTTATSMLKDLYGQDFKVRQSDKSQKLVAIPEKVELVDCPVCKNKVSSSEINRHLDECLNKGVLDNILKESGTANKTKSNIGSSDGKMSREPKIDVNKIKKETIHNVKQENVILGELTRSIDVNNVSKTNTIEVNQKRPRRSFNGMDLEKSKNEKSNKKPNNIRKSDSFITPNTNKVQTNNEPNVAFNTDAQIKIEPGCSKTESKSDIDCPCCGDKLNTSIQEHLDECLSFIDTNSFDEDDWDKIKTEAIVIDDDEDDKFDDTQTMNATGTKLPCPCCLNMVEENDMNSHLDICLS